MNQDLLEILVCPSCKRNLELISFQASAKNTRKSEIITPNDQEIVSGLMQCGCGSFYPVIEGVPRFVEGGVANFPKFVDEHRKDLEGICDQENLTIKSNPDDIADDYGNIRKSFSQEWTLFDYDQDKTWGWTLEERKQVFLEDMNLNPQQLSGKRLLDAGCGNGTLTAALSDFDMDVIGLDLNDGLDLAYDNRKKYAKEGKGEVNYVQGNIVKPPFKESSFDLIYSSGVIHHTPSSEDSFESLACLVNEGGRLYVWVYGKRPLPVRAFFTCGRYLKEIVSLKSVLQVCRLIAPFYKVGADILDFLRIMRFRSRSTREITLDLFDAFAPRYNHWHSDEEVYSWFEKRGFQNINVSGRQKHGFGMYGDKG